MLLHGAAKRAAEGFIITTIILLSPFSKLTLMIVWMAAQLWLSCMVRLQSSEWLLLVLLLHFNWSLWAAVGHHLILHICSSGRSFPVWVFAFMCLSTYITAAIFTCCFSRMFNIFFIYMSALCHWVTHRMQPGLLIKQKEWEEGLLVYWMVITGRVT